MCDCLCVSSHVFVCMCNFFFLFFFALPREMCECVYLFRSVCACVFVFESSNVSEILQPYFIQREVRGSSTNSSPNVLNELFEVMAAAPAVPFTSAATQPLTHPHVCLNSPPSPCRLTVNPTVTMATVSMHTSSQFQRLDGDTPTESHVNCCPSDLVQEQNKC